MIRKIRAFFDLLKKSNYTELIFSGVAVGALFAFACIISHILPKEYTVFTSVINNINIMLITTNATMIGLYVTAFIFLNDSLKSRVKEDTTINDAVSGILRFYRRNMVIIAFSTILVIVATLILNLLLDNPGTTSAEQVKITLSDYRWFLFLFLTAASVFVIIWIILSSRDITNSDKLIYRHSENNRKDCSLAIQSCYDGIKNDYEEEKSNAAQCHQTSYFSANNEIIVSGKELLDDFNQYTFLDAYKKMENELSDSSSIPLPTKKERDARKKLRSRSSEDREKKTDNVAELKKIDSELTKRENLYSECEIELGKIVRLLENMIGRISDNNIDKSIMNTDYKIDSIANGFRWLYANTGNIIVNNSNKVQANDNIIDVRDAKRFLDHIKYRIITHETFHARPFNNRDVEQVYERARLEFDNLAFSEKKNKIKQYKDNTATIIDEFFNGYKLVVGYRDAMVHQTRYKGKHQSVITDEEIKKVLNYAKLLKRVLLDRFMSFVRTDDLSLGNSSMDKGWFNFSELTKSNFTHSSFKYACLENAIFRNCDLSTCSFVMSDASGTDFSDSNFSYSDLTGMDLKDCNLNRAQLNSVILRDARIDSYAGFDSGFLGDLYSHEAKRNKWRKKVRGDEHTENGEDRNEKYKIACQKLRNGETFDTIANTIKATILNGDDTATLEIAEVNLLRYDNEDNVCGTVLDECCTKIQNELKDYIEYRKFSKISKEQFEAFDKLRKEESAVKVDNGKTRKNVREEAHGKVYFRVASLERASVNDVNMTDIDFSHISISGASFRDSDLSGADMYYSSAIDTMFYRTNLISLDAYRTDFAGANFNEATLINANLFDCNLNGVNFKKAIMLKARIVKTTDATEAELDSFSLSKDKFMYLARLLKDKSLNRNDDRPASGLNRNIERANAVSSCESIIDKNEFSAFDSDFDEVIANEIKLMNMNFMRSKFLKASMMQAVLFNNLFIYGTLNSVDMSNAILCGNSFHQANCAKINMQRALLYANEFSNADLGGANFNACLMEKCNFDQTNLANANFSRAAVKNCSFIKCNMEGINIADTRFENVIFSDIDFSKSIGLDEAIFIKCLFEDANGIVSVDRYIISKPPQKRDTILKAQEAVGINPKVYSNQRRPS